MKIWSECKGISSICDIRLPSRSRRDCAPPRYYRASRGNSLPTFRDNLSDLLMGLIGHAETSEINSHYSLCNNPEDSSSQLFSRSFCRRICSRLQVGGRNGFAY